MNRMLVALVMCASGLSAQASKDGAPGEVAFYLRTAGLYDSNLDHDPVGRAAYGGVLAAGLTARDRASRPRGEVAYEAAAHRYSAPSRLERVSHHGEITFTARPARALAFSTEAEVSLRDLLYEPLEWSRLPRGPVTFTAADDRALLAGP